MQALQRPIDVATAHTLSFLRALVPAGSAVLEIGCGGGEVAAALTAEGYVVTGVEPGIDAAAQAAARGVAVERRAWPFEPGRGFDAVAFTRSLHHLPDLQAALDAAARCAGRWLLVEDFAFDDASGEAITWLRDTAMALANAQSAHGDHGDHGDHGVLGDLLRAQDPRAAWQAHADRHRIHPVGAIRTALARCVGELHEQDAPYLYRYLLPLLPDDAGGAELAAGLFDAEARAIAAGRFPAVGRRLWGRVDRGDGA